MVAEFVRTVYNGASQLGATIIYTTQCSCQWANSGCGYLASGNDNDDSDDMLWCPQCEGPATLQ
eukprot:4233728-Amphidinium_carterae.1